MNNEISNVVERSVLENQERNPQKYVGITEDARNANYICSEKHVNIPYQFKWGEVSGEVLVQCISGSKTFFYYHLEKLEKCLSNY